jgi:hypothetical protein
MNTGLGYFPLTNHGICKLFAALSGAALMLLVPTELLLRTAHLKPFAFSLLMPSLCLTIIILVVGDLFVSLAEYAGHKYRHLHGILMGGYCDSTLREHIVPELEKYLTMVKNCEDWGVEALQLGLTLTVGVVIALCPFGNLA